MDFKEYLSEGSFSNAVRRNYTNKLRNRKMAKKFPLSGAENTFEVEVQNLPVKKLGRSAGVYGKRWIIFSIKTKDTVKKWADGRYEDYFGNSGNFNSEIKEINPLQLSSEQQRTLDEAVEIYNSTTLYQRNSSTSSPFYGNFSDLPSGNYYMNATVYGSGDLINYTETRNILISPNGIFASVLSNYY